MKVWVLYGEERGSVKENELAGSDLDGAGLSLLE